MAVHTFRLNNTPQGTLLVKFYRVVPYSAESLERQIISEMLLATGMGGTTTFKTSRALYQGPVLQNPVLGIHGSRLPAYLPIVHVKRKKVQKLPIFLIAFFACILFVSCKKETTTSQSTISYTTDNAINFPNPERGWFYTIDPDYESNTTAAPLTVSQLNGLRTQFNITLVRKYYLIYDYQNTATIAQSYINNQLVNDLNVCRAAGFKLIPRFTYVWNKDFSSTSDKDATESITLSHINQLMPVLNDNIDVIDHLHAGFVGAWGEWHSSTNNHVDNSTLAINSSGLAIKYALLSGLSNKRMIAFRYPVQIHQMYGGTALTPATAYNFQNQARSGFYNDGFGYDETDFGTWNVNYPNPDPLRDFMKNQTKYTIMSGEPGGGLWHTVPQIIEELKSFHFSSLSMNQADGIENRFYEDLERAVEYNNISRNLGYRFSLVSSKMPSTASTGSAISATIIIANSGYAPTHNTRSVEFVFKNKATGQVYKKPILEDPRRWFGSTTHAMTHQIDLTGMPAGVYDVYLNLPDPEASINTRPEYSIRLANTGLWDAATGYNSLLRTLTIQ